MCVQYFGLVLHVCMYSMCINFRYSNYEQPPALCVYVCVCVCVCVCVYPHPPGLLSTYCMLCRVCGQERCPEGLLLKSVAALSTEAEVSTYVAGWSSYSAVCQSVRLSVHTTPVYRCLSACPSPVSLFVHQSPVCLSVCIHTSLT